MILNIDLVKPKKGTTMETVGRYTVERRQKSADSLTQGSFLWVP